MRYKTVGNKRDLIAVVIKNAEVSATIPQGSPVTLICNGTEDGIAVVLPGTAGDAKNGAFKYGVCLRDLTVGVYGEAQVFGFNDYTLITRNTRAATSDSWSTVASSAVGVALGYDSLNNAFVANASMAGSLGTLHANAVLASTLASSAGAATATSDTRTAITAAAKTFIRMMG